MPPMPFPFQEGELGRLRRYIAHTFHFNKLHMLAADGILPYDTLLVAGHLLAPLH